MMSALRVLHPLVMSPNINCLLCARLFAYKKRNWALQQPEVTIFTPFMDEEIGIESLKNLTSYRACQWGDDLNRMKSIWKLRSVPGHVTNGCCDAFTKFLSPNNIYLRQLNSLVTVIWTDILAMNK